VDLPGQPSLNQRSLSLNLAVPRRALAIAAHPDDVEFGCGATLAKWAAHGCEVHYVICTDGSKGTWDVDADTASLVKQRQAEQREAARRLGATGEVAFLGWIDGELASDLEQRSQVAWWIRTTKPEVVLGHDPWRRYRLHPDHRHAGFLACDGIVAARDPHFFRDHDVAHHRPESLLLWEADEPDHIEDVTGFVATKLEALEAHESQFTSTMHAKDGEELEQFRERVRQRASEIGSPHGVAAAEAFKLMTDL
jgi:LmbE family N-acetylglucosaminyl deacetylase